MNCWVNLWVRVCSGRGWVSLGFGERKSPCGVCRSFGTVWFFNKLQKQKNKLKKILPYCIYRACAREVAALPLRRCTWRAEAAARGYRTTGGTADGTTTGDGRHDDGCGRRGAGRGARGAGRTS